MPIAPNSDSAPESDPASDSASDSASDPASDAASRSGSGPDDPRFADSLREAAIEAELETGAREPTQRAALRHVFVRVARMGIGFGVVCLGIVMLPLPGPGTLVIAVGLALLSRDAAWADRLLRRVRERLPSDADGKLPRSTVATMVVLAAAGVSLSLWFMLTDTNPLDLVLFWRGESMPEPAG